MESSKETGWGSLSPTLCGRSMLSCFPIISSFIHPLSDEKTELEQLGRVQGHAEGINGEKSPYMSERSSITEWSMVIHPRFCLDATFGLMLSISACLALCVHFPLSTNWHYGGCPHIITCRTTEHISEREKLNLFCKAHFSCQNIWSLTLPIMNSLIFVIQKSVIKAKNREFWGEKPSNQPPQIFSKLCASLRMAREGATTERDSLSQCVLCIWQKNDQQNYSAICFTNTNSGNFWWIWLRFLSRWFYFYILFWSKDSFKFLL